MSLPAGSCRCCVRTAALKRPAAAPAAWSPGVVCRSPRPVPAVSRAAEGRRARGRSLFQSSRTGSAVGRTVARATAHASASAASAASDRRPAPSQGPANGVTAQPQHGGPAIGGARPGVRAMHMHMAECGGLFRAGPAPAQQFSVAWRASLANAATSSAAAQPAGAAAWPGVTSAPASAAAAGRRGFQRAWATVETGEIADNST